MRTDRAVLASLAAALAVVLGTPAATAASGSAKADMVRADGIDAGQVTLNETPNGVLLDVDLRNLPAGEHGFHIHETGDCTPDPSAAGGHLAGDNSTHGFEKPAGPHAGDMPNIHVPESGKLRVEVLNRAVTLGNGEGTPLLDGDGSAVMIHAGADDYSSQPSGDAGDRIACGVIQR